MCLLLFVIIFCWSFNTVFTENTNLNAIPYSLFHFSIIPILIPNTPYSKNSNASYVEQAMTGFLLGDGVLVKKYKLDYPKASGGTYFKFAQGEVLAYALKLFKSCIFFI